MVQGKHFAGSTEIPYSIKKIAGISIPEVQIKYKHGIPIPASQRAWMFCLFAVMLSMVAFSSSAAAGSSRTVRVGVYQNEPKIFMDQNGKASGIFIDLLNDIAAQAGWTMVYVPCQWETCLQDLQNGQIDLMPDVAYSVQRDAIFDFPQTPVLESWSVIYASPSSSINNISQLNGKRVAVLTGSIQQTDFGQMMTGYGFKTTLVPVDSLDQVFELAKKSSVDAAIANNFFGDYFYQKYGLVKTTIVFDPTTLYYTTAQGRNHDLLDAIDLQLNKWLQQPNSPYYTVLKKWGAQQPSNPVPQVFFWVIGVILGLFLVAAGMAILLRQQVRLRTWKLQQANAELQESQAHYQTLAQISPVGIFRTDLNGSTTYVNPQWCQISGLPADKALGNGWLAAVHPDDKEKISRGWQEAAQQHQPSFSDYRFIRPDGSVTWVMGQAVPELSPQNQIIGYVGTITDITDRKTAEAALQASESQLSLIHSNISDILFYLAVEKGERFRFISVNPAFLRATGIPEEQVVGKLVEEVIPETSRSLVLGNYEKAIQTRKAVSWEEITEYPSGKKYGHVSAIPIFDTDGNCTHLIGTVHDITEHMQAEDEIRKHNNQLKALNKAALQLEKLQSPQILADEIIKALESILDYRYGVVLLIDESSERLLPFALSAQGQDDEFVARDKKYIESQDLRVGKGVTGWVAQTGSSLRLGDVRQDARYYGLRKDIRSELCVPVKVENQVIGVVNIETDQPDAYSEADESVLETIAAQVSIAIQNSQLHEKIQQYAAELELRVAERTAQLEAANKELEAFSYSVSHDLRAPLRAISGFSEIIARRHRANLNEEGQHYVDNIVQASGHMGHLIDDLLTYARLGRAGVRHEPVSLAGLVAGISRNMQALLDEIHGTLTIAEDLPTVTGDQTLLSQVFSNLLENAIKYHKPALPPQVTLTYYNEDNYVVFIVSDNGIGIPLEYQEKIFTMFQRLHSEEEYPGTGIGLATVRKSVTLLGGSVWVKSSPGEGSTFYVRLPKEINKNG